MTQGVEQPEQRAVVEDAQPQRREAATLPVIRILRACYSVFTVTPNDLLTRLSLSTARRMRPTDSARALRRDDRGALPTRSISITALVLLAAACSAEGSRSRPASPKAPPPQTPEAALGTESAQTTDSGAAFQPDAGTQDIVQPSEEREFAELDKKCSAGDDAACTEVGERLRLGTRGAPQDLRRSFAILEGVCMRQNEHGPACPHLAEFYLAGLGDVSRDYARGVELLENSCAAGILDGCGYLGLVLVEGLANPYIPYNNDSWLRGMKVWEDACARGHGHSCSRAAVRYRQGFPVAKNPRRAAELSRRACQLGQDTDCAPEEP